MLERLVVVWMFVAALIVSCQVNPRTERLNQAFLPVDVYNPEGGECETDTECYELCLWQGHTHEACEIEQ